MHAACTLGGGHGVPLSWTACASMFGLSSYAASSSLERKPSGVDAGPVWRGQALLCVSSIVELRGAGSRVRVLVAALF